MSDQTSKRSAPTVPADDALRTSAQLQVSSWNEESGTIDVTWSTGAAVERYLQGELVVEVLDLSESSVRLDQINSGAAPVFDSHGLVEWTRGGFSPTTASVVGNVVAQSVKLGKKASATLRIADVPGTQDIRGKVAQGVLRQVSVGAHIHHRTLITDDKVRRRYLAKVGRSKDDPLPVYMADDWEPYEISLVPVGADSGATTRARRSGAPEPTETEMDEDEEPENDSTETTEAEASSEEANTEGSTASESAPAESSESSTEPAPAESNRSRTLSADEVYRGFTPQDLAAALAEEGQDASSFRAPSRPTHVHASRLERYRGDAIRRACSAAGASDELREELIEEEIQLDVARARILESRADTPMPNRPHVSVTRDENETRRTALHEAFAHRCRARTEELSEAARSFRGMSFLRTAEEVMRLEGIRLADSAPDTILRALHSSSDFPALTADVANLSIQRGYQEHEQSWRRIARQKDAPNFKPMNRPQFGEVTKPTLLPEGAELTFGTVGDSNEVWRLLTYEKGLRITRQAMVNDDTGALDELPARMGRQIRELESDIVWGLLTSNVVMGDGTALFHSDHGNLGNLAFGEAGLSAGRAAMRKQKGLDGETRINVVPRFLMVPPDLETAAQKQVASVSPNNPGDVNPFASQFSGVLVESRLEDSSPTDWYMAADPSIQEVLEFGGLTGANGPVIDSRDSWTHDGMEMKTIYDFGAGVLDHRGLYKSGA